MKELIISKELISEVLNIPKESIMDIYTDGNYLLIRKINSRVEEYNIYGFAFKCKEWILNQKNKDCFYIADQFSLNIESQLGVIKYFWCVLLKNSSRVSPEFKADSEIEAILKACNWVLENYK